MCQVKGAPSRWESEGEGKRAHLPPAHLYVRVIGNVHDPATSTTFEKVSQDDVDAIMTDNRDHSTRFPPEVHRLLLSFVSDTSPNLHASLSVPFAG